ncbi:MAG: hypothetical protein GY861_01345 [bacterium]|nr:hypothetical protein [bacterium]
MSEKIEITFDNTRQDILHGWRYIRKTSPINKKMRRFGYILISVFSIWMGIDAYNEHGIAVAIVMAIFVFIVLLFVAWISSKLSSEYALRKNLPQNADSGILGEHHLTITPEYIIERTEVDETKFLWKIVPRLEEDKKYIYLFQSPNGAHVIPKRVFANTGDAAIFLDKLRTFKQRAQ